MNLEYDWGRLPPMPGYYMALLKDHNHKVKSVVVHCDKARGLIGFKGYTGKGGHCSAGNPPVHSMEEAFIVWARLPDPF